MFKKDKDKQLNPYLEMQVINQTLQVETFLNSLKFAAKKDDGVVDKDEAELIKDIEKISKKYIKELKDLVE